jgi:hypothetical protein
MNILVQVNALFGNGAVAGGFSMALTLFSFTTDAIFSGLG